MITLLYLMALLVIGVAAGFVGSLTGLGGAVVIMPACSLLLDIPIEHATGAALVATIATSSGAAAAYVKDRISNVKIGMSLEIGTTAGAILGALCAAFVYSHNLSFLIFILFGVVVLFSVYPTFAKKDTVRKVRPDATTRIFKMQGSYYDRAEGKTVRYTGVRWWLGESIMCIAGIISGLLGVGSGVLKVLAMDSVMKLPVKVSTATSDFMIGVTAVTGSAIYWSLGYIDPTLVAPIIVGVIAGAFFGSKKMESVHKEKLRKLFTLVLVIVAVEMIIRGLGVA
jgi:uncharacterized membrane protein YfcA